MKIVYIDSNVRKADVIIDGKLIGQTPYNGEIKKNSSTTITVKKEGYQSKTIIADTSIEPFFWLNVAFYYFGSFASYFDSNNIKIYELNIIKIESLISKGFLSKSFVRFLDFSYFNWNLVHKFEDELLIRFGIGYAYNLQSDLQVSLIPYLGLRFYDISNRYKTREVLGLRFNFQHIINSFMKYKFIFEYDINNYYSYNKLIKFEYLLFNNNNNFNIFKSIDYNDSNNDFKFKIGISIFI